MDEGNYQVSFLASSPSNTSCSLSLLSHVTQVKLESQLAYYVIVGNNRSQLASQTVGKSIITWLCFSYNFMIYVRTNATMRVMLNTINKDGPKENQY